MARFESARMTEREALLGPGLGFTIVVVLLGVAGIVVLRSTRAIETDAEQVGREQLATARLLNDLPRTSSTTSSGRNSSDSPCGAA